MPRKQDAEVLINYFIFYHNYILLMNHTLVVVQCYNTRYNYLLLTQIA